MSTATQNNPVLHLKTLLHGPDENNEIPLETNDFVLYFDGSSMRPDDKTILAGYAIIDDRGCCREENNLQVSSAQAAELIMLTRSCILGINHFVTI